MGMTLPRPLALHEKFAGYILMAFTGEQRVMGAPINAMSIFHVNILYITNG